ncbi:hypothetical protein HK102_005891 [Quaeritorhiza haematococci]|nr:hypothetical protein HK102_005891 [Quaeritorhiza haematococci]
MPPLYDDLLWLLPNWWGVRMRNKWHVCHRKSYEASSETLYEVFNHGCGTRHTHQEVSFLCVDKKYLDIIIVNLSDSDAPARVHYLRHPRSKFPILGVYDLMDQYPIPLGAFKVDYVSMEGDEALMDLIDEEDHRFWSLFCLESYLSKTKPSRTPPPLRDVIPSTKSLKYIRYVATMQQTIPSMITGRKRMPARKMIMESLPDKPAGFQAPYTLIHDEVMPPASGEDSPVHQWWDKQGFKKEACLRGGWTFAIDFDTRSIRYSRTTDQQCVGQPRFEVIQIHVVYATGGSHANIVLIDHDLETVEYFEPDFDGATLDLESIIQVVKYQLRQVWNIPDDYQVVHPLELCIHTPDNEATSIRSYGPQVVAKTLSPDPRFRQLNEHTCLFWCLFYVTLRIQNPGVHPMLLLSLFNTTPERLEGDFLNFVRSVISEQPDIQSTVPSALASLGLLPLPDSPPGTPPRSPTPSPQSRRRHESKVASLKQSP